MKRVIDWNKAPEGAVAHTTDANGGEYWWSEEPKPAGNQWLGSVLISDDDAFPDWRDSLQLRPAEATKPRIRIVWKIGGVSGGNGWVDSQHRSALEEHAMACNNTYGPGTHWIEEEPDADGWVAWHGGDDCPVPPDTFVRVIFWDRWDEEGTCRAGDLRWRMVHKYCVHKEKPADPYAELKKAAADPTKQIKHTYPDGTTDGWHDSVFERAWCEPVDGYRIRDKPVTRTVYLRKYLSSDGFTVKHIQSNEKGSMVFTADMNWLGPVEEFAYEEPA